MSRQLAVDERHSVRDSTCALLRQSVLALDAKPSAYARSPSVRLPAADADRVITLRHDRIPVFRHHAQVARSEMEMHLLARARVQMDSLEAAQRDAWSAAYPRKLQIELNHLVSGHP